MQHIQFPEDSLAYEEVLNWRGFAFETSKTATRKQQRKQFAQHIDAGELSDGCYGIAESDRIIRHQEARNARH
jgi:hypothetical protein